MKKLYVTAVCFLAAMLPLLHSCNDGNRVTEQIPTGPVNINIDLNLSGVQLTYLGGATVRGIEMLSLKTGAGNDTVKTLATVLANTSTHGFDDQIETNDGDDIVTVTGGRDVAAMGAGSDTLDGEMPVTAFRLEGAQGDEYWLGLPNFFVITRYNRSVMYAMAVNQLAESLVDARGAN